MTQQPDPPVAESGPLYREPALTIGFILALLIAVAQAALGIADKGGFEDGVDLTEISLILAPIAAALGTRFKAFSQATVDRLATRSAQEAVVIEGKAVEKATRK